MEPERRSAPRHAAALSAQIETESGRSTVAVTQDVSASGLLVLSHRPLEIGRGATIYVLHGGNQYAFSGTVVRQEPLAHALWRSKAAVEITSDRSDFAKIVAAVANPV